MQDGTSQYEWPKGLPAQVQHLEQSPGLERVQQPAATKFSMFGDEVMSRCKGAQAELVRRTTAVVEAVRVWKDVLREPDRTRSGSGFAFLALRLVFVLHNFCIGLQGVERPVSSRAG